MGLALYGIFRELEWIPSPRTTMAALGMAQDFANVATVSSLLFAVAILGVFVPWRLGLVRKLARWIDRPDGSTDQEGGAVP